MIGYVPEPNYVGQAPLVENYDPSFGFMLKQGAKKMFSDMSILLPASMADVAISEMRGGKITEEEYKDSEFFDPQIKWDDSFTEAKARLLKDRMDAEREYAYYLEQAQDFTDYIAFYGGVIAGAVPDPLNYIPLLGQFDKPRRALQYAGMGARSSRALLGAADAALLTTLASPLLMAERASYQQKYDAQDVLFDIGIATGLGGGFGALFGRVKPEDSYPGRIPTLEEARAYDPDVPSTITDPPGQLQQFIERVPPENRANAVRKGLLQQRAGKPIDVSAEMQPVVSSDDVRQSLYLNETARLEAIKGSLKDSQIINSDGDPMVMYHGSGREIKAFSKQNNRGGLIYFTPNADEASGYAASKGSLETKTDFQILAEEFPGVFDVKTGKVLDVKKLRKALDEKDFNYLNAEDISKEAKANKNSFAKQFELLYESNFKGDNVLPVYINAKKVLGTKNSPTMKWQEAEKLGASHFTKQGYDGVWIQESGKQKPSLAIFDPRIVKSIYNPGELNFQKNQLLDDLVPDYTVAKLEEPEPLVDEVIAAIEKQSDEELDAGIRELETQNLLKEEDARALARDEDLTTEQSNREIEQYNGNLIFCLMRNG
jgi:hypothetical protein